MDFNLTDEQAMLQKTVKQFSDYEIEPIADKINREGKLPDDLIKKMADLGLFGMALPEQYGGAAMDDLSCILACEKMAYSGCGVWWLLAFNNSIPETVYQFGTEYIKKTFLPHLCSGLSYASIQFTEAETGSDTRVLTTKSIREEGGFVINGSKCFSTFGARDGYTMLFARDQDDNCSAFVARKNVKGYTISKMWDLMGGGGIEAVDVHYENVRLPLQNLLGREGKGMDVLLYWISIEKIQQCAACVGMAQAALDESIKFTRSRMNRGKPIADMQGIRWMLAEMHAGIQAARWMTYRAAFLKDHGDKTWMREAAAAKIMVVPATMEVVELARRLHGAYGYTGEFKIERLYRAIAGASAIAVSLEINKSQVAAELLNTAAGS